MLPVWGRGAQLLLDLPGHGLGGGAVAAVVGARGPIPQPAGHFRHLSGVAQGEDHIGGAVPVPDHRPHPAAAGGPGALAQAVFGVPAEAGQGLLKGGLGGGVLGHLPAIDPVAQVVRGPQVEGEVGLAGGLGVLQIVQVVQPQLGGWWVYPKARAAASSSASAAG